MAQTPITHPYTVKFWYPVADTPADAAIVCTLKAPEIGDSISYGRDQHISKSRGGTVVVYDYGSKFTPDIVLNFKNVPDNERSALLTFFNMVGWAKNAVSYQDIDGVVKAVIISKPSIAYKNTGYINRDIVSPEPCFDFDVELMDVSETWQTIIGGDVTDSALTIHLADFNAPHSPEKTVTIDNADGNKVVDSILTSGFHGVIWIGTVVSGANKMFFQAQCINNRTPLAAATVRIDTVGTGNGTGTGLSDVTVTTALNTPVDDTLQTMDLKIAVAAGAPYTAIFRSIHLGKR